MPPNEACDIALQTGTFNPVIEWKYGSVASFYGPPVVGQVLDTNNSGGIDSQDLPHVFIDETGKVVALRGDGGGVAWVTAKADYGFEGSLALGDLEGDGWPEIITARYSHVCALDGHTSAVPSFDFHHVSVRGLILALAAHALHVRPLVDHAATCARQCSRVAALIGPTSPATSRPACAGSDP